MSRRLERLMSAVSARNAGGSANSDEFILRKLIEHRDEQSVFLDQISGLCVDAEMREFEQQILAEVESTNAAIADMNQHITAASHPPVADTKGGAHG